MKSSFVPESIALITCLFFSLLAVNQSFVSKELVHEVEVLQSLETYVPQYQNEVVSTNLTSTLHYDKYAQLQQKVEMLMVLIQSNVSIKQELQEYLVQSSQYVQLVSMLKTSKRTIVRSNFIGNGQATEIQLKLTKTFLNFLVESNPQVLSQLSDLKDKINQFPESSSDWYLVEQHLSFIVDNVVKATQLKRDVTDLKINEKLSSSFREQTSLLNRSELQFLYFSFSAFAALIGLLIIVLVRQKKQIIIESEKHQHAANVKAQFLANMSHEIRTPMTGIIGLTELCLATNLTHTQKDYLEKLHFSAQSLLTIINDILDFSKIESGKLTIEQVSFCHDSLIANIDALLSQGDSKKQVELIFDISPSLPANLKGDPVRISQVLINLLSNALKFTEQGHVILRVRHQQKGDKTWFCYQVIDTGIGLSEEQMSRLFQRFSQADTSTTRKYGGTGLGLSISKLLVELMGGTISVESRISKGSTFSVELPLIIQSADEVEKPSSDFGGQRVLCVEDNETTGSIIKDMLASWNLHVTVVTSLAEAMTIVNEQAFEFAMVDYQLGKETCIPLLNYLSKLEACPSKVIVFSAFDTVFLQKQLHDVPLDLDFIAKPITRRRLYKLISTKLQSEVDNKAKLPCRNNSNIRVLLVEDNKINQTIASTILKGFGYYFEIAENGQQAIDIISDNSFDIILMDIQMPILDGIEATKVLRNSYSKEALPIIALTANVTEAEVEKYLAIGMNAHLSKPYVKEQMQEVIGSQITLIEQHRESKLP
ncbi:response regulator [Pseudoalteromonas spongiae]|uniref:response regulator n=1 Tax=Pseudoalteromonas spongiae TaxID=298657 RepID=UPI000C2CF3F0|nr:response regulator [Pseudoalteromonas spongiae]